MTCTLLLRYGAAGWLALTAILAAPASLAATAELAVDAKAPLGWREFEIPAGKFKALVPEPPKTTRNTVKTEIGEVKSTRYTATGTGDVTYDILLNDYPKAKIAKASPYKLLDSARDGLMYQTKGKMLSDKTITLSGFPGRELEIMGPGDLHYRARVIWVETRLYQILVVTPGKPRPEADAFFNSFQITGRP